ncbi:MAG TPA: ABC transporter permease [Dehalococcoidales bacterium]|nr:ABC transporter permease [Dehalococcoidales bacterium]
MAENTTTLTGAAEAPPRVSEWRRFRRVFFQRKLVVFGLVILAIMLFVAITANWIAPFNPYIGDLANKSLLLPNSEHWLGTDLQGRDVLSRLMFGTRSAFQVGFITVAMAAMIGMALGVISGYFGGVLGMVIMRLMDALMGFPMIILAMVVSAVLGAGLQNVIIALTVATVPGYARVMNALTLSIRENDYIMAERSIGASNSRTMFKHILPNAMPPMIVLVTLQLGSLILAEAALSFLGIGIKPPGAAWGAMVNDGYRYMLTNPVLSFAPGFAIMLVVFAFNMVGDGLRDALDPRLRGTM